MKLVIILLLSLGFISCESMKKSEEAIVLKIDTQSLLKGREIQTTILINNSEKAEAVK